MMSNDNEDSSTDNDFLAYLLDDDDDDNYDDDVALFSLVGAYITELSRKSCVQRRPSEIDWNGRPMLHTWPRKAHRRSRACVDFNHRLSQNCAVFLIRSCERTL